MDITVKEYEHRHLAMSVCEHECNVGGKYVLPQDQAFGLSWFIAKGGLKYIRRCSWGRTEMQRLSPAVDPAPWPEQTGSGGEDDGAADGAA